MLLADKQYVFFSCAVYFPWLCARSEKCYLAWNFGMLAVLFAPTRCWHLLSLTLFHIDKRRVNKTDTWVSTCWYFKSTVILSYCCDSCGIYTLDATENFSPLLMGNSPRGVNDSLDLSKMYTLGLMKVLGIQADGCHYHSQNTHQDWCGYSQHRSFYVSWTDDPR